MVKDVYETEWSVDISEGTWYLAARWSGLFGARGSIGSILELN